MKKILIKELSTKNILEELRQIGYDEGYRFVAQNKFKYKNIKIYNLTPAQANIIKQTALSSGADCATHREVITCGIESSNAILGASHAQLILIANKLKQQPFNLSALSDEILKSMESTPRKTKLAGILNVTPDSFSDGGKYFEPMNAINKLSELINDGAEIIDIGAESTKPYSKEVSAKEQINRLKPVLEFIQKEKISTPISIDTRNSEVADFCLNNGASIINDISGFDFDKNMPKIISKYKAGVIIQHSKGTPDIMQENVKYNNLIDEIYFSLREKKEIAESYGIKEIIVDPGIGFGKSKENNFEILNRIEEFFSLEAPVMVGVSRKSLLGINNENNDLKDTLSCAISYPLIQKGIDYLRVHNVKLHKYILELT